MEWEDVYSTANDSIVVSVHLLLYRMRMKMTDCVIQRRHRSKLPAGEILAHHRDGEIQTHNQMDGETQTRNPTDGETQTHNQTDGDQVTRIHSRIAGDQETQTRNRIAGDQETQTRNRI